jgi:hypothetical protein
MTPRRDFSKKIFCTIINFHSGNVHLVISWRYTWNVKKYSTRFSYKWSYRMEAHEFQTERR